ncbi:MAG: glycosyltransferase [Phenylobacterium sp.]|uniref:glycosyltransferase n=1 Tax=Phenylobacterium sp. TaxID=1871053 RepID=UPI00273694EE|nr:glycosyltransferase [Phenylobacterium sp.]MDP3174717.1 glycosyltransferase [Phenylobacterium sp.]
MIDPLRSELSVVIGRVSTEDGDRILETLASLDEQQGERICEVVLADRLGGAVSAEIARRYPHVKIIPCDPGMALPEMRTIALEASTAAIVAVTEDHCVPAPGWIGQILSAFESRPDVVAVGGCVENGVHDTGFDWATFLCEYSFFSPPVAEGETQILPGMNVAYRRSALAAVPRARLVEGFWETTVHPLLLAAGGRFESRNAIKMFHCKKFSVSLFTAQRFVYSRYFAGIRFGRGDVAKRLVATAASVALPPLLLWRMTKAASAKGLNKEFGRALPALAMLVVVWAFGEMVGYIAGPGDALARIE